MAGLLGSRSSVATERRLRAKADLLADALGLSDFLDKQVPASVRHARGSRSPRRWHDPDILLLDEPSSGMGPEEARQLGTTSSSCGGGSGCRSCD